MSLSIPVMSAIRFGYGIRPGEQPVNGAAALMQQLQSGVRQTPLYPVEGIEGRFETIVDIQSKVRDARKLRRRGDREAYRTIVRKLRRSANSRFADDQHARFEQAVFSENGFYERLVVFWSDHFSVSAKKRLAMRLFVPLFEARAIRPHLAGSFNLLLKAAVLDPAMLIYLDQVKSIGPGSVSGQNRAKGLNENLGRELLELHTLGVEGGYSQDDVRNASLVLTGMGVKRGSFEADFRRKIAEPGPHQVMGMSFGSRRRSRQDVEDMLDALAAMEQTARHICTKLVVHFIADEPPAAIIAAMTKAWANTSGDLASVYRAMLDHPLAWDNALVKARQPFDYIIAGLRAVNVATSDLARPERGAQPDDMAAMPADADMQKAKKTASVKIENDEEDMAESKMTPAMPKGAKKRAGNPLTVAAATAMGQPTWQPASPAGWEEAFDVWVSSSQLTERITWARRLASQYGTKKDPRELVKVVLADAARDDTIRIVNQAASATAGTIYILVSPEFNRR